MYSVDNIDIFQWKDLHDEQPCMPDMQYRYHINISVYNVQFLRVTEGFLTAVAHVEEPIFILGRFIHGLNQACCSKRKSI